MGALAPLVFVAKTYFIIFCFMMVRGTYSRYRVDQYIALGWKKLIPFALAWTLVFAFALKLIGLLRGGGGA
jgi:NADH-quinone oxidoreductase subunit H